MRHFFCSHCGQLVFFDSSHCLGCGKRLVFVPQRGCMLALDPLDTACEHWVEARPYANSLGIDSTPRAPLHYQLCRNATVWQACNFAIPDDSPHALCIACQHTQTIPHLSDSSNRDRWRKLEVEKRLLLYGLVQLGLIDWMTPVGNALSPQFQFLADLPGEPGVMTGHHSGTITIALAEADEDERVRRRLAMHEPYRTLLGHLRHESGHFYWEQLIGLYPDRLEAFRRLFGDERQDYSHALQQHYAMGASAQWWDHHVSAYASAHPWEDFAETWAHYLHLMDTLETAASYQLSLGVHWSPDGRATQIAQIVTPMQTPWVDFHILQSQWSALSMMLNSLNRSLGQDDAYPFVLSTGALRKLRFVHDLLGAHLHRPQPLSAGVS